MKIETTNYSNLILKNWPLFAGLASVFMLAAAHAFETFGKLYPCALCLHQREIYWIALSISIIAILARQFTKSQSITRAFDAILAVAFLAGVVVAGFHAGVEQHWWLGLPECAGGGSNVQETGDLLSALSKPMDIPSCDKVAWSFLGLSMAVWNMIISLVLAVISLFCALKGDTGSAPLNEEAA